MQQLVWPRPDSGGCPAQQLHQAHINAPVLLGSLHTPCAAYTPKYWTQLAASKDEQNQPARELGGQWGPITRSTQRPTYLVRDTGLRLVVCSSY